MFLRTVKISLIIAFVITFIGFSVFLIYSFYSTDSEKPVFRNTLPGILEVSVLDDDRKLCEGLLAFDNVDGDISDKIIVHKKSHLITNNEATVTYLVFDEASNYSTFQRKIKYLDYEKPHFNLSGPLTCGTGAPLNLSTIGATDMVDGDITASIMYDSSVSTSIAGYYPLEVRVVNSYGDSAYLSLTVVVQDSSVVHPTIALKDYLIYIDRDTDGTGSDPDFEDMILSISDPASAASASDIIINPGDFDRTKNGTYNIYYSYTSPTSSVKSTVILTVVVE